MIDTTWITPLEAGLLVASHYGPQAIANGKPQMQLLDWVTDGRVSSMAVEVVIHAPDLRPSGPEDEDYLISTHDWSLARSAPENVSKFYTSAEVSFLCQDENGISTRVTFAGIRVSKEDVLRRVAVAGWPIRDHADHCAESPRSSPVPHADAAVRAPGHSAPVGSSRGRLPPNASAANRRDEEYAHAAAELVRSGKKLSEALRAVAPIDHTRAEKSIEHAIRRTFDLMYDIRGNPL
ncbi:hypothetical protein LQ953_13220 [Sphingomonas sp. IC-56]|uniref:hypothetical protein n=1 Tax=Sphingomonas sp. IC-56 TaxID=2898529 RepID=UPI001E338F9C|nr:hypothetical protein [Sphingomonas sp. IC-56]MCD2324978.1 hypothetical protein [Sphingomonas sp. IC-56]